MASKDLRFFYTKPPWPRAWASSHSEENAVWHPSLWSLCNERTAASTEWPVGGACLQSPKGAVFCYQPKYEGNLLLQSEDFSSPGRGVAWKRFGIGRIRGEAHDGIRIMGGGVTKCEGSFTFAPLWIVSALQQKGCEGFSFSFFKCVFVNVHIVLIMQRYWVSNAVVLVWTPYAGLLMLIFSKN